MDGATLQYHLVQWQELSVAFVIVVVAVLTEKIQNEFIARDAWKDFLPEKERVEVDAPLVLKGAKKMARFEPKEDCELQDGKPCSCPNSEDYEYYREPLDVWLSCQAFEMRMDPEHAHRLSVAAMLVREALNGRQK